MRSFFRFILPTKALKSSISKTSGTYPDTEFHWFLGFLSDQDWKFILTLHLCPIFYVHLAFDT